MSEWYYAGSDRQQQGPLSATYIGDQFRAGLLKMDTLVWREGMPEWRPLREFADEFALAPMEPPKTPIVQAPVEVVSPASATEYTPYAAPTAALSADAAPVLGGEVVYAGFWKRVAASFVDSMVIQVISTVISMVMVVIMVAVMAGGGGARTSEGVMLIIQGLTYLVSLALTATYYAAFHSSRGMATLGKMAVGIKVVRSDGSRISLLRGIGRYFGLLLSGLILCIGFVMAAFTQRKQALHDMICDTLVVDKWAFTHHPEWQRRDLGPVAIAILVIFAVLMMIGIVAMVAMFAVIASSFR